MTKTADKVKQLQVLEQSRQAIGAQKQRLQADLFEVDNALRELESVDSAFKIVGGIMVQVGSKKLADELNGRKETLELRSKTLDAQELKLGERAKKLQDEVMAE